MWSVYDAILDTLPDGGMVQSILQSDFWTLARTEAGCGLAMTTEGATRPPLLAAPAAGQTVKDYARAVHSWNLPEASCAMAAINACFNTASRLETLHGREPYENYCTAGLDLTGKTIGLVGHLKMPEQLLKDAQQVYILERHPQPGDYPDTACEELLPQCNVVLITGSALINKTLPRLLQLCKDAYTIVTGPTVPMCPALLECGIDRLAGLVLTDPAGAEAQVASRQPGPPYAFGETFLLKRDSL